MERERSSKIVAIVALAIAIVGVSIGFAALSATLTINATNGRINPDSSLFTVQFSNTTDDITTGAVTVADKSDGATGTATVSGLTVTDVNATFSKPGDYVTFNFFVTNTSTLDAFLKTITYSKNEATCSAVTGTVLNITGENNACTNTNMTMDISVGTNTATFANNGSEITTNNTIAAMEGASTYHSVPVTLTLRYNATAPAVDGEVNVDFGTIQLGYSTAN